MDRELIAYLDAKFANIDAKFEAIDQRFGDMQGQMDQRFEDMQGQMDRRFEDMQGQMDQRFGDMQGQMDRRFEDMQGQMDQRFEQTQAQIRETHVVVEDLHTKIQTVAEGYAALDEKVDRYHAEAKIERREDREHLAAIMKAMYVTLSQRDDALEERIVSLESA